MGCTALRKICVITVARSDYGILIPVLRAIEADAQLNLRIVAGGMHMAPEFGKTIDAIESDGFHPSARVEMLLSSDTPLGTAKSIGIGVMGFAEAYAADRPDIIVAMGDRFEMHAAVLAALPFNIPVAHIHGGEVTVGAIDDALRHGITKIAHLHFTSTREYADRVIKMGEEPWRVTVSGAPSLDNLKQVPLLDGDEFFERFGVSLTPAPLLVTFHPVTREPEHTPAQIQALLESLETLALPVVFTLPNADAGGRLVAERIRAFVAQRRNAQIVDNLGTQGYFSIMRAAAAMVGNSSSGIIEAASFQLPVVNVGARQAGRARPRNVIDVADDRNPAAIASAIESAVTPSFRASLQGMENPYGSGNAAATIVEKLRETPMDDVLLRKRFYDA